MPKRRKLEKDKQTAFAKEHYNVNGAYLTDVDGIWFADTENSTYMQYSYTGNNSAMITKLIEVKYDSTDYVKGLIRKEIPPTPQLQAYAGLLQEVNRSRSMTDTPEAQLYLVIQTKGSFPFHVFRITEEIDYDFIGSVNNETEYRAVFEP